VSLASGERTRCGGRVVKNVTGYDMAKLYAGSLGSLGVIESAWLRLRPAPEEIRSLVGTFATPARSQAFELALVAARRESVRVAALVFGAAAAELGAPSGDVAEGVLVAECAGDAAVVSRDVDWLGRTAGARIVPEEARVIGRLRGLQGSGPLRARLAVLPSDLERAVTPLVEAGIGVIALPGVGFVYALTNEASGSSEAAFLGIVDEVAAATGADLVVEALPEQAHAGRDVFGDPGARAPVLQALKQRFDPKAILNPGRSQGFL
jgi:glycolate oxidase FAD binding subunit